ncbi:MAG: hypothetical protein KAH77_12330 [Thiomargarita sp.]|nr:hypothetical protein [Thiomargarita sp.]
MIQHLFKNFLDNKTVYLQNISYWQKMVADNHGPHFKEYVKTHFANGTPFLDGNPIFNGLFDNKALRIIQEEPETQALSIAAWLDTVEIDNTMIPELVISLELSNESAEMAHTFIKAWIVDNLNNATMKALISEKIDSSLIKFAICTQEDNGLQPLKIYKILQNKSVKQDYIRVINEFGDDYSYPEKYFISIDLPQTVKQTLLNIC